MISSKIVIDRPIGTTHHRFAGEGYPVDYGYLEGTSAVDKSGVDIWVGTLGMGKVVGVFCSVDLLKRDAELKILFDCSAEEIELINAFINNGQMRALLVQKDNG